MNAEVPYMEKITYLCMYFFCMHLNSCTDGCTCICILHQEKFVKISTNQGKLLSKTNSFLPFVWRIFLRRVFRIHLPSVTYLSSACHVMSPHQYFEKNGIGPSCINVLPFLKGGPQLVSSCESASKAAGRRSSRRHERTADSSECHQRKLS